MVDAYRPRSILTLVPGLGDHKPEARNFWSEMEQIFLEDGWDEVRLCEPGWNGSRPLGDIVREVRENAEGGYVAGASLGGAAAIISTMEGLGTLLEYPELDTLIVPKRVVAVSTRGNVQEFDNHPGIVDLERNSSTGASAVRLLAEHHERIPEGRATSIFPAEGDDIVHIDSSRIPGVTYVVFPDPVNGHDRGIARIYKSQLGRRLILNALNPALVRAVKS